MNPALTTLEDTAAYLKHELRHSTWDREAKTEQAIRRAELGVEKALKYGDIVRWMGLGLSYILEGDDHVLAKTRETLYQSDMAVVEAQFVAWKQRVTAHIQSDAYEDGLDKDTQKLVDAWMGSSFLLVWWFRHQTREAAMEALDDELDQMAFGGQSEGRHIVNSTEKMFNKLMKSWCEKVQT